MTTEQKRKSKAVAMSIGVWFGILASGAVARADGPFSRARPLPASGTRIDWTGFSVTGQTAFAAGVTRDVRVDSGASSTAAFTHLFGGVGLRYAWQLRSGWVLGADGSVSFPYFASDGLVASRAARAGIVSEDLDLLSAVRGKVGHAFGRLLVFGTGGFAWSRARLTQSEESGGADSVTPWRVGWTAGLGASWALTPRLALSVEYLFDHLGAVRATFPSGTPYSSTAIDLYALRAGLDWRLGSSVAAGVKAGAGGWLDPTRFALHGQLTWIEQGDLPFRSPYAGGQSFSAAGDLEHTATATAFVSVGLWRGATLEFDPELDQGFGLSGTQGIASFPNGEAQKAAYPVPRLGVDRFYVQQVFGLGGEREQIESDADQLAGTRDVSRVTVTVGKLSAGDAFDLNRYADDPRTQFMSWNIYGGGSYDWPMDLPGWTWGAVAELNQKRWALRAAYFLVPAYANANEMDWNIPERGQVAVEAEARYRPWGEPGVFRLMEWVNRANMGSYSEALSLSEGAPPDVTTTRETRTSWGVVANVEQALGSGVGLFSRASWTPGEVEDIGWTDCDDSLSLGVAVQGTRWSRPSDTFGVAGVVEGLSSSARTYFAAGGMGILIGDGRLRYRPEQVLETYYSVAVASWLAVSADYQLVVDPGYNADRGPVSLFAGRVHASF